MTFGELKHDLKNGLGYKLFSSALLIAAAGALWNLSAEIAEMNSDLKYVVKTLDRHEDDIAYLKRSNSPHRRYAP